jgi:hypothetical protein
MALWRRHDGLHATVVDLPGSAHVGRAIVAGSRIAVALRPGAPLCVLDLYDRGFERPKVGRLPQLPGLALLRAERSPSPA